MLFKVLIVFTLYSTISTLSNLVDLPLKVPKGSSVINATLTYHGYTNEFKKYYLQELISAFGPTTKGKIFISSDTDSYTIHYNADSYTGVDGRERLVIQGTNCELFTYTYSSWDKYLSGVKKPILNIILLIGPSILYRLDHSSFVWKSVADKNIRGIMMKGASTEVNENLKITFYYKSHLDYQSGMESPSRIEFSGYERASIPESEENLILYIDIYSIQHVNIFLEDLDQVQNEVQPPTGIGCPHYLSGSKELPELSVNHLHYIMEERIKGSTASRSLSEIYAAYHYDFSRIKTLVGSVSEVIYDYRLGVSFHISKDGSVTVTSIDSSTPGIESHGEFTLTTLFMLDGSFKYLGKRNLTLRGMNLSDIARQSMNLLGSFKHRSGLSVEAWESVLLNANINGKKVDKAVITQYFAPSGFVPTRENNDIFYGYTLVSTKVSIYDHDQSKKVYTWKDGITRDYMNFQEVRSIESIRSLTEKVNYASSDEKVILNFILECDEIQL
uniref:Uncharacterized protein n=1 Tax=Tetranychus urticae TaxID=32264 RepID=T1KUH5_TETUR